MSFGLDPHESNDRWYLYDFFPKTLSYDRGRYPSAEVRSQWLRAAGLSSVSVTIAEHIKVSMSLLEAERAGVLERAVPRRLVAATASLAFFHAFRLCRDPLQVKRMALGRYDD